MLIALLFGFVLLGFARRLAGGGFITFPNDGPGHVLWGLACGLYVVLASSFHVKIGYALAIPLLAYFQLRSVPHQYAVNLGSWPTPQKKWPSFFFPTIDQNTWSSMPRWKKFLYDFGQLACVGFIYGFILVAPMFFYAPVSAVKACLILGVGYPTVSAIGLIMPFNLPSVKKRSVEWGELLTGVPVTLALAKVLGVF